jgi:hypothetical protein
MPPRTRRPAAAAKVTVATPDTKTLRKVTRVLTVDATGYAMEAIAKRIDPPLALDQVQFTFEVERIAGPRDTNARWRFNVPGQMLVVAEDDLPIIEALIAALQKEREAVDRA